MTYKLIFKIYIFFIISDESNDDRNSDNDSADEDDSDDSDDEECDDSDDEDFTPNKQMVEAINQSIGIGNRRTSDRVNKGIPPRRLSYD